MMSARSTPSPYEAMFKETADASATPNSIWGLWGAADAARVQIEPDALALAVRCADGSISGATAAVTVSNGTIVMRQTADVPAPPQNQFGRGSDSTFTSSGASGSYFACPMTIPLGETLKYEIASDGVHMTLSGAQVGRPLFFKMKDSVKTPPEMPPPVTRTGRYHGTYVGSSGGTIDLVIKDDGSLTVSLGGPKMGTGFGALDANNSFDVVVGPGLNHVIGTVSASKDTWAGSGTWKDSYYSGSGTWSVTHQ